MLPVNWFCPKERERREVTWHTEDGKLLLKILLFAVK